MARLNLADRSVLVKIVLYGPAFGGKTTSLQALHGMMPDQDRPPLSVLRTDDDRTLFFDFLPVALGEWSGFQVRIQLYTVPGQAKYNATRRTVLAGADGVLFVADASPDRQEDNRVSLENLKFNLLSLGMAWESLPLFVQANKQDVAGARMPVDVATDLGLADFPCGGTSAVTGAGVESCFCDLAARALLDVHRRYGDHKEGLDPAAARQRAEASLHQLFSAGTLRGGRGLAPTLPTADNLDSLSAAATQAQVLLTQRLEEALHDRDLHRQAVRLLAFLLHEGRRFAEHREGNLACPDGQWLRWLVLSDQDPEDSFWRDLPKNWRAGLASGSQILDPFMLWKGRLQVGQAVLSRLQAEAICVATGPSLIPPDVLKEVATHILATRLAAFPTGRVTK